jgi:hypothetical protein
MFNLNTFSEQLDKIETDADEAKEQERLYQERCAQKRDAEIDYLVNYEFKKAVKIVGDRLTIKKSHATYYAFTFRGINNKYYASRIYANTNKGILSDWDINESHGHVGYYNKKIDLKNLGKILISWVKENLKKDNIKID